jgi:hypothetical protein
MIFIQSTVNCFKQLAKSLETIQFSVPASLSKVFFNESFRFRYFVQKFFLQYIASAIMMGVRGLNGDPPFKMFAILGDKNAMKPEKGVPYLQQD